MPRVLITGTNRGLGHAIALEFHAAGWQVASLNRTLAHDERLGEIACDLRDRAALAEGVARAIAGLGGLDVCVANAAVRRLAEVRELADADWEESLAVNLTSVFRLAQSSLPELERTRGLFVVVGSQAGAECFEGGAAYCCSKAALRALCDVMTRELHDRGVRTTLVTPAAIRNRAGDDADFKLAPEVVAKALVGVATADPSLHVRELDLRPSSPLRSPLRGIRRLQYL